MCVGVKHVGHVGLVYVIDSPEVRSVRAEDTHFCQTLTLSGLGRYEGSKSSVALGGKGTAPHLLPPHLKAFLPEALTFSVLQPQEAAGLKQWDKRGTSFPVTNIFALLDTKWTGFLVLF